MKPSKDPSEGKNWRFKLRRTADAGIFSSSLYRLSYPAILGGIAILFSLGVPVYAEVPDFNKLADAIYLAEGGPKAKVPYGIFYPGCKKTTPDYCRRICLNTLKNRFKSFLSEPSSAKAGGFIPYLAASYAPLGAKNDPSNLNRHWIANVTHFLNKRRVLK